MRTGIPSLVGTLLLILIDLGWAFSGPINWGSGMCNLGNIHLSMVAKIKILSKEGQTTPDLKIPDVSSVSCVNVTGVDQYKLVVAWSSWDSDAVTVPDHVQTTNPDAVTKVPPKGTTQPYEETTATRTTAKTDESTPTEKPENRDSHMDELTDSTTTKTDEPSSDAAQVKAKIGVSTSTTADSSGSDTSSVTTDLRSSAGVSTSVDVADNNEFTEDSTAISDVTTLSELLPQNLDSVRFKNSQGDSIIAPFLCQYCDNDYTSSSRLPHPDQNTNRLTLIITRRDDYFSVSDIYLRFLAPDTSAVIFNVFWKNINLFPGSVDATHVCENVTKLSFNSQSELLLQNVKLAAYLPDDKCDFPEKTADCTLKYGKDETNADFCRNAEVILIVIGTLLGVLLLGSLMFYAAKLYCNSWRERDARDALP